MASYTFNFDPKSASFIQSRMGSTELVVLLHATQVKAASLENVKQRVIEDKPEADIWLPELPATRFSFKDPAHIAKHLVEQIDAIWAYRQSITNAQPYRSITLIGHSVGALLARKVYVYACGEIENAPFEPLIVMKQPKEGREWAIKVHRLILLAAMNRGWSVNDLSVGDSLLMRGGVVLGNLVMWVVQKRLLLFQIKKGAPFITQLRIQWLAMARAFREHKKEVGGALVIQLLGTIDDLVSPEDNIDLVTGSDFVYLEVPRSGHRNVITMDNTDEGKQRYEVFHCALTQTKEELNQMKVIPADLRIYQQINPKVTDVIFVIHGIRDNGFWTQKIAWRIKALGEKQGKKFAIETSSYGYFPMLPFLLPSTRRDKVEWLMDQYTEDLALYPNADFSFVGHSNGTYMLSKALEEYPACHFKNVVFAGSVVPTTYNWDNLLRSKRVKAVLNYVATADWVVAIFPKFFQTVKVLGVTDLGSAGHDGFKSLHNYQVEYVKGSHGAAIAEDMWDDIANFGVNGTVSGPPNTSLVGNKRSNLIVLAGNVAPLLWLLIICVATGLGCLIWHCSWPHSDVLKTISVILYLRILWFFVTKY